VPHRNLHVTQGRLKLAYVMMCWDGTNKTEDKLLKEQFTRRMIVRGKYMIPPYWLPTHAVQTLYLTDRPLLVVNSALGCRLGRATLQRMTARLKRSAAYMTQLHDSAACAHK
jgi:hypothetical protein